MIAHSKGQSKRRCFAAKGLVTAHTMKAPHRFIRCGAFMAYDKHYTTPNMRSTVTLSVRTSPTIVHGALR